MALRLRAWLPLSAGLMLAVAGCRTASSPATLSRRYPAPAPPAERSAKLAHAYAAARRPPVPAADSDGLEEPAEQPQPERKPAADKPPVKPLGERLQLPEGLPGRDAPVIALPEMKPENEAKRKEAIERYFPPLKPLPDPIEPETGPNGMPLTLADLRQTALANNPSVRQALAAVEAARGAALQAGLYPNPRLGYEGNEINAGSTEGKHGASIEQTIKTGGKLQLARDAAEVDVENATLASRKTEIDVTTQVRRGYYSVLAAQRAYRVAPAFATLTSEVFSIQVTRLRLGQAAVYEPLQARVLAVQARATLIQAQNRTISAWKQLAAALGQPGRPLTALAGSLESDVPRFVHDDVLSRVLSQHTDVLSAENSIGRAAHLLLRLAEVTPRPDIGLHYQLQYDKTTQPNNAIHGASVGIEVPLWNRNQGGIREARANLSRAVEEPQRIRNELTSQVAAAFEKYDNARTLVLYYRDRIVPDQVRAYRGIYRRYDSEPDALNFNDVITVQQTLAETIRSYVDSIGGLWESVTELANLLQLDDLDPASVSGKGKLDRCPVPVLEPLTPKHVPVKPKPAAEGAALPSSPAPQVSATKAPQPSRMSTVGWTKAAVPFEVRQLREGNRRISFNVVPLQGE